MTDRERWTVYPLLFLALGAAMRDKILDVVNVDVVQCKSLRCNALEVADENGQLVLSSTAGAVQCQSVLCQALVATSPEGKQQVVVSSNAAGGVVQTRGNDGRPNVIVSSGLLFVDEAGRVLPGSIVPTGRPGQKEAAPEDETDDSPQPDEP